MEGADSTFFSSAWSFGWRHTVINLVDHPELDWNGRAAYLLAKDEINQIQEYVYDLVWLAAKKNTPLETALPSELARPKPKDTRTVQQIKDSILEKCKQIARG